MKKFRFFMIAIAAALTFGSCSDDHLSDVKGGNSYPNAQDGVFFAVNISLPSVGGSRSQTTDPNDDGYSASTSGVEIGKDYENNVGEVVIVLARNNDNSFIAASTVPNTPSTLKPVAADKPAYQLTSTLSLTQLAAFYDALDATDDDFNCNIFVFANPGEAIKNIIFGKETSEEGQSSTSTSPIVLGDKDWINKIVELPEIPTNNIANKAGNSGKGAFLMSNAVIAVREIPASINDWRHYTSDSNPFDLSGDNAEVSINNGVEGRGAVKLERAAARFDFRDGSPVGNFTYHVVKGDAGIDGEFESNLIDIVLSNMSLVNVNKKFYALRRVSPSGKNVNFTLCGPEYPWTKNPATGAYAGGNYVVDADQVWKTATAALFDGNNSPTIQYSTHFFYPLFTSEGAINNGGGAKNWLTANCADVVEGETDNKKEWNPIIDDKQKYPDYHIWTYATENTIAGVDDQKNGISTGVVFKGKMVATEAAKESIYPDVQALANAISNPGKDSPFLYSFGGNLYVGWESIRNAAINSAVSGIKWVPDSEDDPTKGKFEFTSIDRSNTLYVAVFGTGGFGTVEFTYTEYNVDTKKPVIDESTGKVIQHTGTITDELDVSENCADAKWTAYKASSTDANLKTFKETVTGEKITIYQTSNDNDGGWGYYCYYYYWNRHNNNGDNGIMGPMEFAVVRNNVYKLAVTNIKQLGHPRLSENDPNKPTGGTDDETSDVYLTVTAEVLPWVVRINDIEF